MYKKKNKIETETILNAPCDTIIHIIIYLISNLKLLPTYLNYWTTMSTKLGLARGSAQYTAQHAAHGSARGLRFCSCLAAHFNLGYQIIDVKII